MRIPAVKAPKSGVFENVPASQPKANHEGYTPLGACFFLTPIWDPKWADFNGDLLVNVLDVVSLVNEILS